MKARVTQILRFHEPIQIRLAVPHSAAKLPEVRALLSYSPYTARPRPRLL